MINKYNHNLAFKLILPKVICHTIKITFQTFFHFFIIATPATFDSNLKPSIYSSNNNTKTLELFNKSSLVDFTTDEILTELGNEIEILDGSILLFPPINKQEISPSYPNVPFKSSSLYTTSL